MKPLTVLVLGAGASGLAAAGQLATAGARVIVLEARDRVGGRICTLRTGWPVPIEAGPEFIHGDTPELNSLLVAAQIKLDNLPEQHWRLDGGIASSLDFEPAWDTVLSRMQSYSGRDLSFADFIRQHCSDLPAEARMMTVDYVEGFNGADQHLIGVRWLRRTEAELGAGGDSSIRRVAAGFDQISNALLAQAKGAEFRLNSRVTEIRWQPGRVEVETADPRGTGELLVGDCAIVTLPLGVLQTPRDAADAVRFVPELPAKRAACSQLKMGSVVKVALWFREPIWHKLGADVRGFLHTPGRSFMTWWPLRDSAVLTGWSGGPRASSLARQSEPAILAASLAVLARDLRLEPRSVAESLLEGRVFNWQSDPFARGAYSYAFAGGANVAKDLAQPIANTLFFAGEATETAFAATVAGAIRSGYRAAEEIQRDA